MTQTNEMTPFMYEGKEVRVITRGGAPWWVLKDVCEILGLTNSRRVASRLDSDEKGVTQSYTSAGKRDFTLVSEAGLYSVILRSDKPEARAFKRWVTHEVLPQIRQTGAYMTEQSYQQLVSNPDTFIKLLTAYRDEKNARADLETKLDESRPKVLFAEAIASAKDTISIGFLAKLLKSNGIEIGAIRLFAWLREHGYLMKGTAAQGTSRGDYNVPTQQAMERGLFEVKETVIHANGTAFVNKTTRVTSKGQKYFINKFLAHQDEKKEEVLK